MLQYFHVRYSLGFVALVILLQLLLCLQPDHYWILLFRLGLPPGVNRVDTKLPNQNCVYLQLSSRFRGNFLRPSRIRDFYFVGQGLRLVKSNPLLAIMLHRKLNTTIKTHRFNSEHDNSWNKKFLAANPRNVVDVSEPMLNFSCIVYRKPPLFF